MSSRGKRIVIVRHGERVDHRFQDEWVDKCFDDEGNYTRYNLNQPETLPRRKGYPRTFLRDSPLTEIGCLQATLRGKGIAAEGVLSDGFQVYVSPSFRCIETASNLLKAMKQKPAMNVEPCLFEWTQIKWYLNGNMPKWMSPQELLQVGFSINLNYERFLLENDLKEGESIEAYYSRSHKFILHLLEQTGTEDLLLVAHGFSIEALSRQLLGFPIRKENEVLTVVGGIPYCGMIILEQDLVGPNQWKLLPLVPPLQLHHKSAHEFDARKTFK